MSILSRLGLRSTPHKPRPRAAVPRQARGRNARAEATESVVYWLLHDDADAEDDEVTVSEPLRLARDGGAGAVRAYVESQPPIAQAMSIGGIGDDLMNLALDLVDWERVVAELISQADLDEAMARMAQDE